LRFTDPEWKSVKEFFPGGMPTDDDTNYTVLYTLLLEKYGPTFTSEDVADFWLSHFPYVGAVCCAEKIVYRNLANNVPPPQSARHFNPGREHIGAQIRGDAFGYIAPGMPEKAAMMAYKDACVSHVQNGIYGEMWVAAMLAAAYVSNDISEIIEIGLSEIPKESRLTNAIRTTVADWKKTRNWKKTISTINRLYGKHAYHEGHTINNATIVALGLLEGAKDFEQGVTVSVMCGFDTDCNGATVGSILGLMHGRDAIDKKWTDPLNDTLFTNVTKFDKVSISGMAEKSLALAAKMLMSDVKPEAIAANELKAYVPRSDNYWELPSYVI